VAEAGDPAGGDAPRRAALRAFLLGETLAAAAGQSRGARNGDLTFALDEARASLVERLRRRLAVALFGEAIASSSLTWVWASRVPPGTRWDSPYAGEVKLTALASGPGAGWREETVDVVAEYRRRFDRPPAPLQAVALMTDADGVCGRARAEYAELRFLPAAR